MKGSVLSLRAEPLSAFETLGKFRGLFFAGDFPCAGGGGMV